ncbi:hypothetical protein ACL6C3_07725 [Capilliphycus salinus ALCB114379]|uniref:hypothetical protein n=1 Tax=Capilliphycus salinus TaxID=2768948 RepID=UPI0039A6EB78
MQHIVRVWLPGREASQSINQCFGAIFSICLETVKNTAIAKSNFNQNNLEGDRTEIKVSDPLPREPLLSKMVHESFPSYRS